MCDDGGRDDNKDVTARTQRRQGRSGGKDAAATRTRRRERNGDEDAAVTEGRSGRMEGRRADLGTWRGREQICAHEGAEGRSVTSGEPPEDGGFVEGRGAEEVSDGGEEGGDGEGYAGKLRGDDRGGAEEVSDGGEEGGDGEGYAGKLRGDDRGGAEEVSDGGEEGGDDGGGAEEVNDGGCCNLRGGDGGGRRCFCWGKNKETHVRRGRNLI
ncbi:TATA-binding protein-associated factor 2N-like [Vigna umbellata]|uniref:TATA-binding protein-associated factor 2N-like n=1 Tax=Vigna umbellata TaxID=87088 RepID=UPI001F5EB8E0|nr:TATA-binding protein-associated factor 2N-like [Vigna umbellata]